MLNYRTYIKESLTQDEYKLYNNILSLGEWLYTDTDKGGLGLKDIITDKLLKPYSEPITKIEIDNFIVGLNILRTAGYINNNKYVWWSEWIKKQRLIKENGFWSPLNKVNTNINAISYLIASLIQKLKDDGIKYGFQIENKINTNPKEGLELFVGKFEKIFNHYIKSVLDLKQLVEPIIGSTTDIGEKYEDVAEEFFKERDFEIKFKGGNGNFIDMIFGTDLIVYHQNYGYKRVQVKPSDFKGSRKGYIKKGVEWLAKTKGGDVNIFDMESLNPIDIKINLF